MVSEAEEVRASSRRRGNSYSSGAWFVELAPLCDPDLVPQAVATAVGLEPEPGRDLTETVIAHLSTGAALIVLDNCEHVWPAAPPWPRVFWTPAHGCAYWPPVSSSSVSAVSSQGLEASVAVRGATHIGGGGARV